MLSFTRVAKHTSHKVRYLKVLLYRTHKRGSGVDGREMDKIVDLVPGDESDPVSIPK